jgi:hypothetical protein
MGDCFVFKSSSESFSIPYSLNTLQFRPVLSEQLKAALNKIHNNTEYSVCNFMNAVLLQKLSMRLRLIRVHGSYLVGVWTVVILLFYLTSTVRDSRESDTAQDTVHEEVVTSGGSEPDLNRYMVSVGETAPRQF